MSYPVIKIYRMEIIHLPLKLKKIASPYKYILLLLLICKKTQKTRLVTNR